MARLLSVPADSEKHMSDSTRRFTTATYKVEVVKQEEFVELLKGAEAAMREAGLITDRPPLRMRSLKDPTLMLEVFEWADEGAFGRAQKDQEILSWWGKFEAVWIGGGFGLAKFPEAELPWAQYEPID